MTQPIFNLVYSSWDWEKHYYFYGPEGTTLEQFNELCDQLLPQAGYKAVQKESRSENNSWVTWHHVVESLIPLLQEQGYQLFELSKVQISASGIIGISSSRRGMDERLGYANKLIYDYNRALDERIKKLSKDKGSKTKSKKFLPQIMK